MSALLSRFCHYCGMPSSSWPKPQRAWKSPYCCSEHRRLAVNEKKAIKNAERKSFMERQKARVIGKAVYATASA